VSDYLRWQVLYAMVDGLAVEGPLRQRLAAIAKYMAPRVESSREEEPVLKAQMLEILQRLSHVKAAPSDDGDIDATVKRLTDEDARSIAHDIVELVFSELRREPGDWWTP
jgi:hypothetical protein